MGVVTTRLRLDTGGDCEIVDVTPQIAAAVADSGLQSGIVTIFVPGSTGGLTTLEYEPGCVRDLQELMDRWIPENPAYHHHETWNDGNGHSHLRSAMVGPSLTVPFAGGAPVLGTWQQVVFLDFDNRGRRRELVLTIMGE